MSVPQDVPVCVSIRGISVSLEPLAALDADELFAPLADPSMWTYTDDAPPANLDALRARFRRLESRRSPDGRELWLNWAVRVDGKAVGFVQATIRSPSDILIAYALARSIWGRGYATDATGAMLAHLAALFPQARFEAVVDERNVASLRLLVRLGFSIVDASDARNLRLQRDAATFAGGDPA